MLPNFAKLLTQVLLSIFTIISLILCFVPWQQTSKGQGNIIAFDPNERIQKINSPIAGRIQKWFVNDGTPVKKGDSIVEIVDNDPNFIDRLKIERDSIFKKYQAAKLAGETAEINLKRQRDLFEQGLSSRVKLEKSKITYQKLLASEATAAANLAKAEVKLSRQQSQLVIAPTDGTILRVLHGAGSVFLKEGDNLAIFVPKTFRPAAEIFVSGNDLPLISPGRKVRLQFEGWPAIQFSGWPSVAVGTFGGIVRIVDPAAFKHGKFRVIVTPDPDGDEDWPSNLFLRQGTRVHGWVLLDTVKLGYELWRQFNGFPPMIEERPASTEKKSTSKKKKKAKKYKDLYK